jgi:hypothetical protein
MLGLLRRSKRPTSKEGLITMNRNTQRKCPECWNDRNIVWMNKICPLGKDVGGFIWQCPSCKTIVSDWKENTTYVDYSYGDSIGQGGH